VERDDTLGMILERSRRDHNAWASGRRLRRAVREGFAAHDGERGRWLRVSQRGIEPAAMARRWSLFSRDVLTPAYPWWSDWLRVTGVTKTGHAHAHVVWFGGYLPHDWLVIQWGRFSGGDDAVWLDEVKGHSGAGVSKYLGRQFVEYLSGQGVRARWSASAGWRSPGAPIGRGRAGSPPARGAETGKAALEFVRGRWYSPGRPVGGGPLPVVYAADDGSLHSMGSVADIIGAARLSRSDSRT
jgi:hypothetical protein